MSAFIFNFSFNYMAQTMMDIAGVFQFIRMFSLKYLNTRPSKLKEIYLEWNPL